MYQTHGPNREDIIVDHTCGGAKGHARASKLDRDWETKSPSII